jgi:hypothetical protein
MCNHFSELKVNQPCLKQTNASLPTGYKLLFYNVKTNNTYFNFPNLVLLLLLLLLLLRGICFEDTKHFNNYLQHMPNARSSADTDIKGECAASVFRGTQDQVSTTPPLPHLTY